MEQDIRWKQRFANFARAVKLLREPIERGIDDLSDLEKQGTVQRFEIALELAWKTLKDYLQHEGRIIEPVTPRAVIKDAFAAHVLREGDVWIAMLDHRNLLSHTYDEGAFDAALAAIKVKYLPAIEELHAWFAHRMTN